jgi:hypothetical protein
MGAIFISYRRGDTEGQARALSQELEDLIGKDSVFMDVDSIGLGRDFRQVLQESLGSCDLMLVLIGPRWLDAQDSAGSRRLESPTDFVRQEIATALSRNIRVTPVLIQGAQMPAEKMLPDEIKALAFRNGFELSHTRWESDVKELVRRLGLSEARTATDQSNRPVTETEPVHAAAVAGTNPVAVPGGIREATRENDIDSSNKRGKKSEVGGIRNALLLFRPNRWVGWVVRILFFWMLLGFVYGLGMNEVSAAMGCLMIAVLLRLIAKLD